MAKFWPICPILLLFVDILLKEGDNFPCQVLSSIMLHFDNSSKVKLLFTKCADYQQRHSRVFAFQSFPLSNGGFVYCFRREVTMDKMFLFTKNISKAIFFESRNQKRFVFLDKNIDCIVFLWSNNRGGLIPQIKVFLQICHYLVFHINLLLENFLEKVLTCRLEDFLVQYLCISILAHQSLRSTDFHFVLV